MRLSPSIRRLQTDVRYPVAAEALTALLHGSMPEPATLARLYGLQRAQALGGLMQAFLDAHAGEFGEPRGHVTGANTKVSDARSAVENIPAFQRVQGALLLGVTPAEEDLEPLYGRFAGAVRGTFHLFLDAGLRRTCGITATAHLNRVGAVVHTLGMDHSGDAHYAAVGAMHDMLEDLLSVLPAGDGKPFGISRYRDFLDRYVPPELHLHLKLITNFYDLLLHDIRADLEARDRTFSTHNLIAGLETMYDTSPVDIHPYLEKLHYEVEGADLGADTYGAAKWLCYRDLYIYDMAVYTHGAGDYRTFEIKGVDLSDNGHGREALSLAARIRNLCKQQVYVTYGRRLRSTWHAMNDRIEELQEDVLVHAEHMILSDLLEQQSPQDFLASALHKIPALRTVFFAERGR